MVFKLPLMRTCFMRIKRSAILTHKSYYIKRFPLNLNMKKTHIKSKLQSKPQTHSFKDKRNKECNISALTQLRTRYKLAEVRFRDIKTDLNKIESCHIIHKKTCILEGTWRRHIRFQLAFPSEEVWTLINE